MIVSADYIRVENGEVVGRPGKLPDTWGRYVGLRTFSNQRLAQIGWFPVVYEAKPCSRGLEFVFEQGAGRVVGKLSLSALPDYKRQEAQRVRRLTSEMMALGFPVEIKEELYLVIPGSVFWSMAPAALLTKKGMYLEVVSVNEKGPIYSEIPRMKYFSPEELEQVVKQGIDFINTGHFSEVKEHLDRVYGATDFSDLADEEPFVSAGLVLARSVYDPRKL